MLIFFGQQTDNILISGAKNILKKVALEFGGYQNQTYLWRIKQRKRIIKH